MEATAAKRVLAFEMATKMHTSRAAVNRLLDPQNTAVTLNTMEQAATALGKRLRILIEDPVRSIQEAPSFLMARAS